MAEVITRFKLETTQYDSKLRDAAKALNEYTHHAQLAGNEFGKFTQKNVEAARAFGNIETSATNSKDKVKELVGAFNEVARAYNVLTKEQQQSDYGKALSESMTTLKGRIKDAKEELYSMGDSGKSTGGVMDLLKDKLTINIDALKLFNAGVTAVKAALDVATDAFFNSEQNLDEWGRVVQSSESIYKGFLNALNTGDISGFLSNISDIVKASRDAYDALDELNTYNAFNQRNVQKARTGMTEAIVDYREGNASKENVRSAGAAYKKELADRMEKELNAYNKGVVELARQRGIKAEDLMTILSGKYGDYSELKSLKPTGQKVQFIGAGPGGGTYTTGVVAANERERLALALRNINDTEIKNIQALGAQADKTAEEIAQVDKQLLRVLNGRQSGGGSGGGGGKGGKAEVVAITGSIDEQTKKVQELQKAWRAAADDNSRQKIKAEIEEQQYVLDRMTGKEKFDINKVGEIMDLTGRTPMADLAKGAEPVVPGQIEFSKALQKKLDSLNEPQKEANLTQEMGKMVGGIQSMVGGIENLGVEIPQGMKDVLGGIQSMITILSGISTIITAIEAINAADAIIPFARGGIVPHAAGGWVVPGNDHADRTLIAASSGELILNRAQQGNLASQLEGGAIDNLHLSATITGEQIRLALNNNSRRTGNGEYVTTNFR